MNADVMRDNSLILNISTVFAKVILNEPPELAKYYTKIKHKTKQSRNYVNHLPSKSLHCKNI